MREQTDFPRGRARPVADAPVSVLVARSDDVAREWLLALLAASPLSSAASVPVAAIAAEGPALCAAMARALADDGALDALEPGAAAVARVGVLAGAAGPAEAAASVEALRGVLWTEAMAELRRPSPDLVADLAARLALVAAVVTRATLSTSATPASVPADGAPPPAASGTPTPTAPPAHAESHLGAGPDVALGRDPLDAPSAALATDAARAVEAAASGAPEVRAHDLRPRVADGDPVELLERAVDAHELDRRTFAVLLVELDGLDRLLAVQHDGEVTEAVERAEQAIETLLRPGDGVRRDPDGRLWIALAGTGPAGARALALRVAAAVEGAADHRGTPLTASVGVAVFPVDAPDAHALADHAEDALFTVQATGSRGGPPPGGL